MKNLTLPLLALSLAGIATAQAPRVVTLPGSSPLVTIRIVFQTGAADDPVGKEGVAALTAAMIAGGGSRSMTYQQIVDAMFPMATDVTRQVDKEMTTFTGVTHVDNLDKFYGLFRGMLLEPGWRQQDFTRLRDDAINFLRVSLRGNNDEELGKEVMYNAIYAGHPYGHHNMGVVSALEKLTLADVQQFYKEHYTQGNLILGVAGGYPASFLARVKKDFAALPKGQAPAKKFASPKAPQGVQVEMVEKQTRSVAVSIGFPIAVRRGDPDFLALLLAQSWLGPHRASGGHLFQRIRELRGLNYGDYAYIEYFPNGMSRFEPSPNLGRQQQIFQLWIRPLEPPTAHFGIRLALFELDRFIKDGMSQDDFDRTRKYLTTYVNLLTKTKTAELGYAIDSVYYGIPNYTQYVKEGLAKLTLADVNRAIRKHLQTSNLQIVIIGSGNEEFRKRLLSDEPSPMKYNAEKPADLLAEDKIVEKWKLGWKPENVRVVPVDRVFE